MTSQDDPSQFPKFADADVLIYLSAGRIYALHAGVLRRNSTRLAEVLDDANGATLSTKAKKDGTTVRFRLDLVRADVGPGNLVARVSCFIFVKLYGKGLANHCLVNSQSTPTDVALSLPPLSTSKMARSSTRCTSTTTTSSAPSITNRRKWTTQT